MEISGDSAFSLMNESVEVEEGLTTCCFFFDIKQGTTAIALFQPIYIIFACIASYMFGQYHSCILCIFPLLNLIMYIKYNQHDNEHNRLRFYQVLIFTTIMNFCLAVLFISIHHTNQRCKGTLTSNFQLNYVCSQYILAIQISCNSLVTLLQVYFVFIARQNWLNCKAGIGDHISKKVRQEQLIKRQQEVYSQQQQK